MLLPRFKKVTLAIAADGIALREGGNAIRMLSGGEQKLDSQLVLDTLHEHYALLKGRAVNLVLANTFVRFIVLPWQPGLFSRDDWNSLASHEFRAQYGAVADQWKIKVNLRRFGESVVAAAIDQALYDALLNSAKQLDFEWQVIEPAAIRLLNQAKKDYLATLIVEPKHLMLCETFKSQFTRFTVMSPPSGGEAALAAQMLARWQLQLPESLKSSPAVAYISSQLKGEWAQENQKINEKLNVNIVMPKKVHPSNASWLTTI